MRGTRLALPWSWRSFCAISGVCLGVLAGYPGLSAAQLVSPVPPSPSAPAPRTVPGIASVPYALVLTSPGTADPRKPIPLVISLINQNGKLAPAPAGVLVNLTVTTLRDLQQAKGIWVKEEAARIAYRDGRTISLDQVRVPPKLISGQRDIVEWRLPSPLNEDLLKAAGGPPPLSVPLDHSRTTAFQLFLFPAGRNTVTVNLTTSYVKARLTVAVQAARLSPAIRTITVAPPQQASVFHPPAAAAAGPPARTIALEIGRQDYRLMQGWWRYYVTASIAEGTPPDDCYLDLRVTLPLKFDDPLTDEPVADSIRLQLLPTPAPSATAILETVTRVDPDARPRTATIKVDPHCQGFTPARTDLRVDIPPRPHKLVAMPDSLRTYRHSGKVNITFYVRDEFDTETIPAMAGQEKDGVWQVTFKVEPPSAGDVVPANHALNHVDSTASVTVKWSGPGRATVTGLLTTTSSREPIQGAVQLSLMFPLIPFLFACVAAPLTQLPPATRILPPRAGLLLSIFAGLGWAIVIYGGWYAFGPVVQEVTLGPVKLGFTSGEVSGSFWVAAVIVGILLPLLIRLALAVYRAFVLPMTLRRKN